MKKKHIFRELNKSKKDVHHTMPQKLYDKLLDIASDKGFQTMTDFMNHIFREYVEKEKK